MNSKIDKKRFSSKHKILLIVFLIILVIILGFVGYKLYKQWTASNYQKSLNSFYAIPSPLPSTQPGYIIRSEKLNLQLPYDATAWRILYVSQLPNGQLAVTSGRIFVPNSPAPAGGRKVVAWAHGTLGFGDECTPSRSQNNQLADMQNWLNPMMQRGWVVTATDYVGIGTTGEPYYLIGQSEAHDVLNSVRAARNFTSAQASNEFALWGHSQGGHSSLFSAALADSYTPELHLVAVAAAAPAAELNALFNEQYNKAVSWGIGPDAAVSWPLVYPNLEIDNVLSSAGRRNYNHLARGCVVDEVTGIEIRSSFREQFFSANPMENLSWYTAASEQTPNTAQIKVPIFIAQGLSDNVVLPNTTALLVQKACQAKKDISVDWLGSTSHTQVAVVSGPTVTAWLQDRFNVLPNQSSCDQPMPIDPAQSPARPSS